MSGAEGTRVTDAAIASSRSDAAYFLVCRYAWFHSQMEAFGIFLWYSLYLGVLCAAVGSFFSVPGALDGGSGAAPTMFHQIMGRPMVINTISVGLPVLLLAFLTPICVFAQKDRSGSFHDFRDFAGRIENTISADNLTTASAQSYLDEASLLWSESAAQPWTAIGFGGWAIFYGILLIYYLVTGGYMLLVIKRQVDASKVLVDREQHFQHSLLVHSQPAIPSSVPATVPRLDCDAESPASDDSSSPSTLYSSLRTEKNAVSDSDVEAAAAGTRLKEGVESPAAKEEALPLPQQTSHSRRPASQVLRDSPLVLRWRYLRRCFNTLLIMYVGIAAVVCVAIATATWYAAYTTTAWLKGPEEAAYNLSVFAMVVTWARVVFGTATVGAVSFRFFDHAEARGSSRDHSSRRESQGGGSENRNRDSVRRSTVAATSSNPPRIREISSPGDFVRSRLASVPEVFAPQHISFQETESPTASRRGVLFELASPIASTGAIIMLPAEETRPDLDATETPVKTAKRILSNMARSSSKSSDRRSRGDFATSSFPQDVTRGTIEEDDTDDLLRYRTSSQILYPAGYPASPPMSYDPERRRLSLAPGPPPDRALPTPIQRERRRPESAGSSSSSMTFAPDQRRSSATGTMFRGRNSGLAHVQRSASVTAESSLSFTPSTPLSTATEERRRSSRSVTEASPPNSSGASNALALEGVLAPAAFASTPPLFRSGWNGFTEKTFVGPAGGLSPPPPRRPQAPTMSTTSSQLRRKPSSRTSPPTSASGHTDSPDGSVTQAIEAAAGSSSPERASPSAKRKHRSRASPPAPRSPAGESASGVSRTRSSVPLESPVDGDARQPISDTPDEKVADGITSSYEFC